jgi:uncharacterized protein YkwD
MLSARVIIATAALLLSQTARADLVDIVNGIRNAGCGRDAPVKTPVESGYEALDAAARLVAAGVELSAALEQSGYRATSSTLINISGVSADPAIREVLADGFCKAVNNPAYKAIGSYVRGNEFWLVLAAPFRALDPGNQRTTAERVLALVNDARAEARRCGRRRLAATHALTLSTALTRAAAAHAADMAGNSFMDHRGSDGSSSAERVTRVGYRWRAVGENVAAGQRDAAAVVQSWLESPGHCANLMGPQFTEMGVAFELAPQSDLRILWAQVLAAPQ